MITPAAGAGSRGRTDTVSLAADFGSAAIAYNAKRAVRKTNCSLLGAGSRGRTDTVSLPRDFESRASANSAIPAC